MFLQTLNSQFGFSFKALHIHTFLLSLCYSNCYFISVLWFTSHQQKVLSVFTTSFFSFSIRLSALSISPFLPATALSCTFSRTVCTLTPRTVNQRFTVLPSTRKGSSSHQFTTLLQQQLSWQDWEQAWAAPGNWNNHYHHEKFLWNYVTKHHIHLFITFVVLTRFSSCLNGTVDLIFLSLQPHERTGIKKAFEIQSCPWKEATHFPAVALLSEARWKPCL